jgi:hypothetical protein
VYFYDLNPFWILIAELEFWSLAMTDCGSILPHLAGLENSRFLAAFGEGVTLALVYLQLLALAAKLHFSTSLVGRLLSMENSNGAKGAEFVDTGIRVGELPSLRD